MFNSFVAERCSKLKNKTELLTKLSQRNKTFKTVSAIDFLNGDILKIVRNLDQNKTHGHNMVCMWMMEFCNDSICKPLKLKKNESKAVYQVTF